MLSRLTVRNLVIVRELDVGFGDGMTALTGETGAGKSILIDAVSLALGAKADNSMIRHGCERAEIGLVFSLPKAAPAMAWLRDNDLDDNGECILRRVLVRNGRSRAYVNGAPCPLSTLRELGDQLLELHAQHAHQALLHAGAQRRLLDAYGGLNPAVETLGESYRRWRRAEEELQALNDAINERAQRLDFVAFQLQELEQIDCRPETLAELVTEQARLAHAEQLLAETAAVVDDLAESEMPARDLLAAAAERIAALVPFDPSLETAQELLAESVVRIDDAVTDLRHCRERIDIDPAQLNELDEALQLWHDLARKHRVAPEALGDVRSALEDELSALKDADDRTATLQQEVATLAEAYRDGARTLNKRRRTAAKRLAKDINADMHDLGMPQGQFEIAFDNQEPGATGTDRISFLVAVNAGQPLAALSSTASGGELSRISLAIQVATAACGEVSTLIFDEVDVGIGGAIAEIVGQRLARLGSTRQVLCVTHLAQVASQADYQLKISKRSDGDSTETSLQPLNGGERIQEVARMLGGVEITKRTLGHAREMIGRARKTAQ